MDREFTIAEFEELINLRIHMVSLQSQGVVYEKNNSLSSSQLVG